MNTKHLVALFALILAGSIVSDFFSNEEITVELNGKNFEATINSSTPVLINFYSGNFAPVVEELAQELNGLITIGTLDSDKDYHIAKKYEVRSKLVIFKNGRVVERLNQGASKELLKHRIFTHYDV